MPHSTGSFTVPKSSVKSCKETERHRPGKDTVRNALTRVCYLLAQHPHVTSMLLSELEAQLAGQPLTPGDLEWLPYLELVVKVVLRIYPPAASLSRDAREPFEWKA